MYEYEIHVEVGQLGSPDQLAKLTEAERGRMITASFLASMERGMRKIADRDDGTWEIVSHDAFAHGPFLVVSFVLRRPAPSSTPTPSGQRRLTQD